jgi:hypothetical protein
MDEELIKHLVGECNDLVKDIQSDGTDEDKVFCIKLHALSLSKILSLFPPEYKSLTRREST